MSNGTIQVNYEQLAEVVNRFEQQVEENRQMMQRLQQKFGELENGGWEGEGAQSFLQEMNGVINPALQRLVSGLEEGGQAANQIARTFREAEETARSTRPLGNGESHREPAAEPTAPSASTATYQASADVNGDTNQAAFVGTDFMGEGDAITTPEINYQNIETDIKKGMAIRDDMLDDLHQLVSGVAAMPENPIKGKSLIKDALKGKIWKPLGKSIVGMFAEIGIANQAGKIAKRRNPLYRSFAQGLAVALDPSYQPYGPANDNEKAFYDLGKQVVNGLGEQERYQLKVALADTYRLESAGIGMPFPRTPKYVQDHYDGSSFSQAIVYRTGHSKYRYRNP